MDAVQQIESIRETLPQQGRTNNSQKVPFTHGHCGMHAHITHARAHMNTHTCINISKYFANKTPLLIAMKKFLDSEGNNNN